MRSVLFELVLVLCLSSLGAAQASTWLVATDESGDFTVIQEAVDAAAPGDTVLIGPGRYSALRPVQYPTGVLFTVAQIAVDSLTIRGASRNSVVIGPEIATPSTVDTAYAAIRVEDVRGTRIESLTAINGTVGIYTVGQVTATDVEATNNEFDGIRNSSSYPLVLRDSHFFNNEEAGVFTGPGDPGSIIERCSFQGNRRGILLLGSSEFVAADCTFQGSRFDIGIKVEQGASGIVRNCSFGGEETVGVLVALDCDVELLNNRAEPGYANLQVFSASHVFGRGNVFKGGSWATIELQDRSSADLSHNDIYKGAGHSLLVRLYGLPAIGPINVSNNYWGTVEPDSVAAWIFDGIDDAEVQAVADWQPILDQSVPIDRGTMGQMKGAFRKRD